MNNDTEILEEESTYSTSLDERSEKLPIVQQLGVLALILLLIFGTGYVPKILRSFEKDTANTATVPHATTETDDNSLTENAFESISIRAKAAFVLDVSTNTILFEKNAHEQLPLASITKLMTALVAHELLADTAEVPITQEATEQDGFSGLSHGETFSLNNILDLTLLNSSNDGAYAIAAAVGARLVDNGDASTFVEAMNIKAHDLGLSQTYFRNPTGLDISKEEGGAYGSARDTAFLMKHILLHYPNILEKTTQLDARIKNDQGAAHQVENTNPTVANIEGLIGSKTGYTELAGGNLAIAFDAAYNRPIIVVVLGSTYSSRFDDVLALTKTTRDALK